MGGNLPVPIQGDWSYHAFTSFGIALLVLLYFFGVWSRSYIFPTHSQLTLWKQLVAAVPIGLITMGIYAPSHPTFMFNSPNTIEFDGTIALGYAIVFGMLSRESLERLLHTASLVPVIPPPPTFPQSGSSNGQGTQFPRQQKTENEA